MTPEWLFSITAAGTSLVWLGVLWLVTRLDSGYLIAKSKSENRTPVYLRGKFYYIIPEDEYSTLRKDETLIPRIPADYIARKIRF